MKSPTHKRKKVDRIEELARDVAVICFGDNFEDNEVWGQLKSVLQRFANEEQQSGIIETHDAALKVIISKRWTVHQLNDWVFDKLKSLDA